MKALLTAVLVVGFVGAMSASAFAKHARNICNGGMCRTIVYSDSGSVEWVSDLWEEHH